MEAIYAKTPKGQDEMANKTSAIAGRVRRVLIMVDGRRGCDELRTLTGVDDVPLMLEMLSEGGFVEAIAPVVEPTIAEAAEAPPAFRPAPNPPNKKEMDMARNFIMNSFKTFCGPYAHLDIVEKAHKAATHEELRAQFLPWLAAIRNTRSGAKRLDELAAQLLKVI